MNIYESQELARQLRDQALADIQGDDPGAAFARASLSMAWSHLTGEDEQPELRVEMLGEKDLDPYVISAVGTALQAAVGKIGQMILRPHDEITRTHPAQRSRAQLIPALQAGRSLVYHFQPPAVGLTETLDGGYVGTLAVRATTELVEVLPANRADQQAIEVMVARRTTMRNAVLGVAQAVAKTAGMTMTISVPSQRPSASVLLPDQAERLKEALREQRVERRTVIFDGRLDGARTIRRVFYLILGDSDREIHGGFEVSQWPEIQIHLGEPVRVELEEVVTYYADGRRSRPTYRWIRLHEPLADI